MSEHVQEVEGEDGEHPLGEDRRIALPEMATRSEAAAMLVAIDCYLREQKLADNTREVSWDGLRWTFAGRLEATAHRSARVPTCAPRDAWTAVGRGDRY